MDINFHKYKKILQVNILKHFFPVKNLRLPSESLSA
jgi:hypothetical protein